MALEELGEADALTSNDSASITEISPFVETATSASESSGHAYRPYAV